MSSPSFEKAYVLAELRHAGAIMTGSHFVYASGMHGSAYMDKDLIYVDSQRVAWLCRMLAQPFLDWSHGDPPTAVVGPAIGGIILSQHTSSFLDTPMGACDALYAEKDGKDGYVLRRGYAKRVTGRRVLVVEDVLTTGRSARKTVEAVRRSGGEVVGVAALVNRGGVTAKDVGDVPVLHALLDLTLDAWLAEDCPLCAQDVPIDASVGRGAEFLARKHGLMR